MPAFKYANVESACNIAWSDIGSENPALSPADVAAKRERLIVRTKELLSRLMDRNKLRGWTATLPLACGSGQQRSEREMASSSM
jgi:hypothetical protein